MCADSSIEVYPFDASLGAGIRGVDLRDDLPGPVVFEILEAFSAHPLLVFRNQRLSIPTPEGTPRCGSGATRRSTSTGRSRSSSIPSRVHIPWPAAPRST